MPDINENASTNKPENRFVQARKDEIDALQNKLIANHLIAITNEGNNLNGVAVRQNFAAYYLDEKSNIEGLRKTVDKLSESTLSKDGKKEVFTYIDEAKNKVAKLSSSQEQMDSLTKKYLQVNGIKELESLHTLDEKTKTSRSLTSDEKNNLVSQLQQHMAEPNFDLNHAIKYSSLSGHNQAIDKLVGKQFSKYFTKSINTDFGQKDLLDSSKLTPENIKAFSKECNHLIDNLVESKNICEEAFKAAEKNGSRLSETTKTNIQTKIQESLSSVDINSIKNNNQAVSEQIAKELSPKNFGEKVGAFFKRLVGVKDTISKQQIENKLRRVTNLVETNPNLIKKPLSPDKGDDTQAKTSPPTPALETNKSITRSESRDSLGSVGDKGDVTPPSSRKNSIDENQNKVHSASNSGEVVERPSHKGASRGEKYATLRNGKLPPLVQKEATSVVDKTMSHKTETAVGLSKKTPLRKNESQTR